MNIKQEIQEKQKKLESPIIQEFEKNKLITEIWYLKQQILDSKIEGLQQEKKFNDHKFEKLGFEIIEA